jgi:2-methylcitrate dehydratase PrpD
MYSCAQQSFAAVEATLRLKERWPAGKALADITQILVEGHPLTLSMNNRNPSTALAGRFSVPHVVATVCATGRADADAFSEATLDDSDIRRLRSLVELKLHEPLAPPNDRSARVTLKFNDGTLLAEDCLSARGGPDQPLSPQTILEKCETMTRSVYPNFAASAARLYSCDATLLDESFARFIQNQLCADKRNITL